MKPVPILLISDAPTSGTGLGRITRDIATRIHAHLPEFRVATAGYGGAYSSVLGFHQYQIDMSDWVIYNLPHIWKDFAGDDNGIILTIWDASRMLWFSRPENCENAALRNFLTNPPFEKWGYFPIDATGPDNKLTKILAHIIEGYDRALSYSKWAEDILRRTLSGPILDDLTNLPHGIDTTSFQPRNRQAARHGIGERVGARNGKGKFFHAPDDAFMVGVVATNNPRKDWGLAIQTVAELSKEQKVLLWAHTDHLEKHWGIPPTLYDLGRRDPQLNLITNLPMTDEQMSWMYSACDVTLGIGMSEGFGYPIFESLACGTPCIHGNDGGAPEHMPAHMLVPARMYHMEGVYPCVRPVHATADWVQKVRDLTKERTSLPEHLDWNNLWPRWAEWLKAGLHE